MTHTTEKFIIQRTLPNGSWVDLATYATETVAAADFSRWAKLKQEFFFVKLIRREVIEEELLLDNVLDYVERE